MAGQVYKPKPVKQKPKPQADLRTPSGKKKLPY